MLHLHRDTRSLDSSVYLLLISLVYDVCYVLQLLYNTLQRIASIYLKNTYLHGLSESE